MSGRHAPLFVSIASYRDPDTPNTLEDLFAKAAHPERVAVGVLWQVEQGDGAEMVAVPQRSAQVRGLVVDARESMGVCWARHRIQRELWQGEEYYLQIDSHTRFEAGWDRLLVEMLARCPSPRPVLSTHPNPFIPPGTPQKSGIPVLTAHKFNEQGVLMPKGKVLPFDPPLAGPLPGAFIGAGFLFGPGSLVHQVPYDPHLYFHGEEITLAVRLWTHGYDLFAPDANLLYHDYTTDRGRRRHWSDHGDWPALNRRAEARVCHLLQVQGATDPEALRELEVYGLGRARSLDAYQRFADVSFLQRRIGVRALDGRFPPPIPREAERRPLAELFGEIYRENRWQAYETRSGPASTLLATALLRQALPALWHELGVEVLVDAGCGDLNWLAGVSADLRLYLGFDIVEELIQGNRILFAHRRNHHFATADISRDPLPRGDALLCRHVLTHLPGPLIQRALGLFRQSGARWLLATTFPGAPYREIESGQWRAVDLCAPPFGLPPPVRLLPDGDSLPGGHLGVWPLSQWAGPSPGEWGGTG